MTRIAMAAAALVALGCSSGTEPGAQPGGGAPDRRVLGTIEHYGDAAVVSVPDTVVAGETFTVRVRTYGGGCVSQGHTEAKVSGTQAMITPFDIRSDAEVCTQELRFFDHAAELRFEQPGTAEVVVRGVRKPGDEVITIERRVVVR